jgi:hypothetical protein
MSGGWIADKASSSPSDDVEPVAGPSSAPAVITSPSHSTSSLPPPTYTVSIPDLVDITEKAVLRTSSAQAMVGSLTDNSTESFWESDDKEGEQTYVRMEFPESMRVEEVSVYIDNQRDLETTVHKISIWYPFF